MCTVHHVTTEEEPVEEFGDQCHEPEPEDPYCEEFPEGFEDGKFNPILWCIFIIVLLTQPIGLSYKLDMILVLNPVGYPPYDCYDYSLIDID